jgi:hypothetical protein
VKIQLAGKDFTASRWQRKESLEETVDMVKQGKVDSLLVKMLEY